MTTSNPIYSLLVPSRIGDTRILTPYAARALDLWFMLRLWPNRDDQQALREIQRAVHASTKQMEAIPGRMPPSPSALLGLALEMLTRRDMQHKTYLSLSLFSVALARLSPRYRLSRPYNGLVVFAQLVDRTFTRTEEDILLYGTEVKPFELLEVVAKARISQLCTQNGSDDMWGRPTPEAAAERIAVHVLDAITDYFPEDAQHPDEDCN